VLSAMAGYNSTCFCYGQVRAAWTSGLSASPSSCLLLMLLRPWGGGCCCGQQALCWPAGLLLCFRRAAAVLKEAGQGVPPCWGRLALTPAVLPCKLQTVRLLA